jgi:hypothetical protein
MERIHGNVTRPDRLVEVPGDNDWASRGDPARDVADY